MNLWRISPSTLMLLVVFFVAIPSTLASPQESAIRIRTTLNESWDDRDVGAPDDLRLMAAGHRAIG
jgi:hypothetical protein